MLTYVSAGIIYAFAAVVQPGPFITYLLSQSVIHGWKRILPAALAPLLSDVPIVVVVLLVLGNVPQGFQRVLQVAGGGFLIYLAWSAFGTWRHNQAGGVTTIAPQVHQSLFKAVTVNLLNPNPYIGWSLVMGPLLLQAWHEGGYLAIMLLVAFYGTMVTLLAVAIILFGTAGNLSPRVSRALIGISALGLAAFGCIQLWLGGRSFFIG